jgi:hypothetical protein
MRARDFKYEHYTEMNGKLNAPAALHLDIEPPLFVRKNDNGLEC